MATGPLAVPLSPLGTTQLTCGRTSGPCRFSASHPPTAHPSSHTRPPNLGKGQGASLCRAQTQGRWEGPKGLVRVGDGGICDFGEGWPLAPRALDAYLSGGDTLRVKKDL